MKVMVTGSGGQLSDELCRQLRERAIPVDRERLDISDRDAVARVVSEVAPDVLINAAGHTDPDAAEREPEACWAVNADGVGYLADACAASDSVFVQIGSDYVFGGNQDRIVPYREDEPLTPCGVYAWSKEASERHAARVRRHFTVRTCGLYGIPGSRTIKRNFVDAILQGAATVERLRVIADQYCSPSYVPDVARAILFLVTTDAYGTYHLVNRGGTSWYEFAAEIFRRCEITKPLDPITTEEWGAAAPRPRYSVLDTRKYHALGGPALPAWQDALPRYLATIGVTR